MDLLCSSVVLPSVTKLASSSIRAEKFEDKIFDTMADRRNWSLPQASNPFGHEHWTVAGSTVNGTVYVVSKSDTRICLWSYNSVTRRWRRLDTAGAVGQMPFVRTIFNGNVVAAYNERLGVVDVFLRPHEAPAVIVRFFLNQSRPNCNAILWPESFSFPFRMTCGKNGLFHFDDSLVFVASERACPYAPIRLRLIQIHVDGDESSTYTWTQMWTSDTVGGVARDMAKVGEKLLVMLPDKILIFEPRLFGTSQWDASITLAAWPAADTPWMTRYGYLACCTPPDTADRLWLLRSDGCIELTLHSDQLIIDRINRFSSKVDGQMELSDRSSIAASASHMFVFLANGDHPVSKAITPPSLQSVCLTKLFSLAIFERCDSEKDAMRFGVPMLAWRRYCT